MSSMNTMTNLSKNSWKTRFIKSMNTAGALELAEYINTPGWNRPAFYNDDDDDDVDYTIAITPVLSTEKPDNSLSIGDEHLDTILATELDEVMKSSVKDLVPIPSESKDEEIKDDNLREKMLNVNLLIVKIEALKDNPTPSSEFLTNSSSTSPKSFLEETNTFYNSLPEFENFCFDLEEISSGSTTTHSDTFYFDDGHIKEISSGSTTTHSDISLSEYDSFIFDLSNDQFPPTNRSDFAHEEFVDELSHIISLPEYDCFYSRILPDLGELISIINSRIRENLSTTSVNLPVEDDHSSLLAYVIWIFLSYLTYPVIPPYLHSFGNEDTIFDLCIAINRYCSFKPGLSHRCGTFKKFNTHLVQYSRKLKDSCQRILSSKSSFPQLQLGIILLHLAGSQPMLKSSYKAEDGVIISIPPLVEGVADVVVEIKGTDKQEKDKIRTKPDENGKRGKAWQCRRPITVKKAGKEKKIQVQWTKQANPRSVFNSRQTQGLILHFTQSSTTGGVSAILAKLLKKMTGYEIYMQTRSSSRLVSNPSSIPTPSTNPNPKVRNRIRSKQRIEEFNFDELSPPIVTMVDQRTMAQLLQAPTKGYEDAIVVPAITADNFELKHGLLTLVQNKQFFGHDKEDPHAHIQYFNKITSTLKFPNFSNTEAWDKFKDLLRACPYHGFLELHQLDTFYNALNSKDQDLLNFTAGGNFLDKIPRECLAIIESKSKVHYSRNKPVVAKVCMNTSTSGISHDVAELKDMVKALLLDKKSQNQAPATVKAVKENCVVENEPEATKDTVHPTNNGSTEDVQPPVVQSESLILNSEPVNSPIIEPVISLVSAPMPNQRTYIPYPSRLQDQKLRDKANNQRKKFFQIFKDLNFNISFVDALILMLKFGPSIKSLWTNKDKLCDLARTLLNEHCSTVLLKKLPEKLGDPDKFLIPLLADHSISHSVRVAEDVYVKVGTFHFPTDFVVVDFDDDPRVRLILERSFLKTGRALIDVFEGELTLRVGKEAITFNLDQTSRYPAIYNDMTAKRIDVIDMACEEYSQEVLEVDAFLALEDDPTLLEVNQSYLDSEGTYFS
nr:reverse transcriptase domain-containing protein [Tanacetum cinerariifolium]